MPSTAYIRHLVFKGTDAQIKITLTNGEVFIHNDGAITIGNASLRGVTDGNCALGPQVVGVHFEGSTDQKVKLAFVVTQSNPAVTGGITWITGNTTVLVFDESGNHIDCTPGSPTFSIPPPTNRKLHFERFGDPPHHG